MQVWPVLFLYSFCSLIIFLFTYFPFVSEHFPVPLLYIKTVSFCLNITMASAEHFSCTLVKVLQLTIAGIACSWEFFLPHSFSADECGRIYVLGSHDRNGLILLCKLFFFDAYYYYHYYYYYYLLWVRMIHTRIGYWTCQVDKR